MSEPNALEVRLSELEIDTAYQRETIDALNETVTSQWKEIDRLSQLVEQILSQLRQPADDTGASSPDDPPPPHY